MSDEDMTYSYSNDFSWIDDKDNSGVIDAKELVDSYKVRTTTITRTSRYRKLTRLLDSDNDKYVETSEPVTVPKSPTDTFHIVTMKDENRLDLISWQYYGNSLLWWIIAEASDIKNPFDVPRDTVLRIPDKSNIFGLNNLVS